MNRQEKQPLFRLLWTQKQVTDTLVSVLSQLNRFTFKRMINKTANRSSNSLQNWWKCTIQHNTFPLTLTHRGLCEERQKQARTDGSIWWWRLHEIIHKGGAAADVKCLCLRLESKSTKGEHWPRAAMSQWDRGGFRWQCPRGAASLLPLLICTAAPPMGRKTLLLLVLLYCERPRAIWHCSGVRWAVIQPGFADCQCGGLPVLMHMVVMVGGWRGGLFHFLFLRQSHRWICFEPVCRAFNVQRFRAADWTHCSLTWSSELRGANPLNLERKHLSASACHFDCISVCFIHRLINPGLDQSRQLHRIFMN